MKNSYILFFIVTLIGICIVNTQTLLFVLLTYSSGLIITRILCSDENNESIHLYTYLFSIGALYMLLCFVYMQIHNFKYMFAFDTINYFLPTTQFFSKKDIITAFVEIWSNFSLFSYFKPGYFTYSVLFAYIGKALGADTYMVQQTSILLLYTFSGIVLYKILVRCGFNLEKSFKQTLVIMLCSVAFFYSSQILRDIHILLLYLGVIYYMLDCQFYFSSIVKIVILSLICCTFRIESGLFLIAQLPIYLWININSSKNKDYVILISLVVFGGFLLWILPRIQTLDEIFERNQKFYTDDIASGAGIIGMLQRIPIIGNFLSIIYNMLLPVPFWSRFSPPIGAKYGVEVYNIMRFPVVVAAAFTLLALITIITAFLKKNIREMFFLNTTKPFKYQLFIGFVFLYLQAAIVDQRRLLAYYFVFYILFFVIWNTLNIVQKKSIITYFIGLFSGLQIIGMFLLK